MGIRRSGVVLEVRIMANLKLFCFVAIVLVYSASARNNRKFLKKLNDELKALENLEKEPLPEVQPVKQEPLPEVQPVKQGPLPEVQPGKSGPRPFSASHAHGRNHPLLEYLAKNHVNLNKAKNHARQVESRWLCSWFGWFCDEEDDYDYDYDDDDSTSTGSSTGSSTTSSSN